MYDIQYPNLRAEFGRKSLTVSGMARELNMTRARLTRMLSGEAELTFSTAAADSGAIDFAHDAVGYGLCQWTYFMRKQNLLACAISMGVTVGDETMQVNFCLTELKTEYRDLWEYLTTAQDLYDAAARICKEYERPAVNNIADRANAGNALYMQYGDILTGKDTAQPPDALSPEAEEPNAKLITWRLAKRAARDFLRVSFMPSAIVSAATHGGKTAVRVYGKY